MPSEWFDLGVGGNAGDALLEAAQNSVPYDSGAFHDSLFVLQGGTANGERFELFGSRVGTWIIKGTKPHPIDPVGARALHWNRGAEVFAMHVDHPGTAPNDFRRNILYGDLSAAMGYKLKAIARDTMAKVKARVLQ